MVGYGRPVKRKLSTPTRSRVPKTNVKHHLSLSESDGLMLLLDICPAIYLYSGASSYVGRACAHRLLGEGVLKLVTWEWLRTKILWGVVGRGGPPRPSPSDSPLSIIKPRVP